MIHAGEEKKSVLEALQSQSSVITLAASNGSLCWYARKKEMKHAHRLPFASSAMRV